MTNMSDCSPTLSKKPRRDHVASSGGDTTKNNVASESLVAKQLSPNIVKKAAPEDDDTSSSVLLSRDAALRVVESAYASIDGYAIAKTEVRAQRDRGVFVDGVQYGEIDARVFADALDRIGVSNGQTFVDVGSGTGKAVLTVSALYQLDQATGLEIQKPLHDAAEGARKKYQCQRQLATSDVRFLCDDAFDHPWYEYDIVFVNAAVFTPEMVNAIDAGATKLKSGSKLLITTRPPSSKSLVLKWQNKFKMEKGSLLIRAYERL